MYSLYSAHVLSCHYSMFREHHHFNIFGIEWDGNIIITVISDHLSHAQGRWLVYFSFTKLTRRPNGHVTAATAHYHQSGCCGAWNLSKLLSFTYSSNYTNSQLAWRTNQTDDLLKSFNPAWSTKLFYITLTANSMTGIVVVPCVHLSVPNDVTALTL